MSIRIEEKPHLIHIYSGKEGKPLNFRVIGFKSEGSSIGSIFEKERILSDSHKIKPLKKWLGKIGAVNFLLSKQIKTIETLVRGMNLSAIGEKIASDCYKELSQDAFFVPKTRLSNQPIIDLFTKRHPSLKGLLGLLSSVSLDGSQNAAEKAEEQLTSLRVMSQFVDGYINLGETYSLDDKYQPILFCDYIKKFCRPPEQIIGPEGVVVKILGMMELLATGRMLADPDIFGGSGMNAGIVWVRNETEKVISAKIVKVDPAAAFNVKTSFVYQVNPNWVISKEDQLEDPRDIQTSTWNRELIIKWTYLSPVQKKEFLLKLLAIKQYLEVSNTLLFLFYRDGMFNRGKLECIPQSISIEYERAMRDWFIQQINIYKTDIDPLDEWKV